MISVDSTPSSSNSLTSLSLSSSFPFPDGRDHRYEVIADGETVYKGRSRSLAMGLYREARRDGSLLVAIFLDGSWVHIRKDPS